LNPPKTTDGKYLRFPGVIPAKREILSIWENLTTSFIGRMIFYARETGSTNEDAKLLADEAHDQELGCEPCRGLDKEIDTEPGRKLNSELRRDLDGALLIAETQTQGKGRLGRRWVSPKGGVFMSLILKPRISPSRTPSLALVVGYALAKSIRENLGLPAVIKWPNDILINRKKASGILCEMRAEIDQVRYVVVGVGINANVRVDDLPGDIMPVEIRYGMTSLSRELGRPVDRGLVVAWFLNAFEPCYLEFTRSGLGPVLSAIDEILAFRGEPVTIRHTAGPGGDETTGILAGVDPEGHLLLRVGQETRIIPAGDVSLR